MKKKLTFLIACLFAIYIILFGAIFFVEAREKWLDQENVVGTLRASQQPFIGLPTLSGLGYVLEHQHQQNQYWLHNFVQNGGFDDGDIIWEHGQGVEIVDSGHDTFQIWGGGKILKIFAEENGDGESNFSQDISLEKFQQDYNLSNTMINQPQCLSFWMSTSFSQAPIFYDDILMQVWVNNNIAFEIGFDDFFYSDNNLGDWKNYVFPLPDDLFNSANGNAHLSFHVKNSNNFYANPVIYIDNVSTNCSFLNQNSEITIKKLSSQQNQNATIEFFYKIDGQQFSTFLNLPNTSSLSFDRFLTDHLLQFQLCSNNHCNSIQQLPVFFSNQNPQTTTDLTYYLDDDEISLAFSSPNVSIFDRLSSYDFRFAKVSADLNQNWDSATALIPRNVSHPSQSYKLPRKTGTKEIAVFDLPTNDSFYIAVKSQDYFGNYSSISNIIFVQK